MFKRGIGKFRDRADRYREAAAVTLRSSRGALRQRYRRSGALQPASDGGFHSVAGAARRRGASPELPKKP